MNNDKRKSLAQALTGIISNNFNATEISETKVIRQKNRQNKKVIAGYFDLEVARQLKQIAAVEDTTLQDLLAEALNELFLKRKMATIAK